MHPKIVCGPFKWAACLNSLDYASSENAQVASATDSSLIYTHNIYFWLVSGHIDRRQFDEKYNLGKQIWQKVKFGEKKYDIKYNLGK